MDEKPKLKKLSTQPPAQPAPPSRPPKPEPPPKVRVVITEMDGLRFGFGFLISVVLFWFLSIPFLCFLSILVPGLFR